MHGETQCAFVISVDVHKLTDPSLGASLKPAEASLNVMLKAHTNQLLILNLLIATIHPCFVSYYNPMH